MSSDLSLTQALVALDPPAYARATQSPFLLRAAQGRIPKRLLGQWLANDRLYIHAYIRAIGRALARLALPETAAPGSSHGASPPERLLKWMVDALANIHREEAFFVSTARAYGIDVNLPTDAGGRVPRSAKSEGLLRIEALFDSLSRSDEREEENLPWLEFAVVLWGTEQCYLDAWTGAAAAAQEHNSTGDADGGALRNEFIPNWTSREFRDFVAALGAIIDDAVRHAVQGSDTAAEDLLQRVESKWRDLLAAEAAFWPDP